MPTVDVTSPPLTASTRLRAAMRLTRWLADHGSDPTHVVVRFRAADPMTYFAGGVPLTQYQDEDDAAGSARARWAFVVCHIHRDRDDAYRSGLADEVRAAVGPADGDGHCLVRFEPTDPERVFYLRDGSMTNSSPVRTGGSTEKGN